MEFCQFCPILPLRGKEVPVAIGAFGVLGILPPTLPVCDTGIILAEVSLCALSWFSHGDGDTDPIRAFKFLLPSSLIHITFNFLGLTAVTQCSGRYRTTSMPLTAQDLAASESDF